MVGETSTLDCSVSASYSAEANIASDIALDVSALSDGEITLCVIGADASNNWQSERAVTEYTWVKDTVSPDVSFTGVPASTSALRSVELGIESTDNIDTIAVGVGSSSQNCKKATWGSFEAFTGTITADLSSQSTGEIRVCVRAQDVAGNVKTKKLADTTTWDFDADAPDMPVNFNQTYSDPDFNITWDAGGVMAASDSYILIRSKNSYPSLTHGVEYAVGYTFDDGAEIVYDGSTDSYSDIGVSDSTYYYYVYARDEFFNYSDPAENAYAPAKAYQYYRFYTRSLTGACSSRKNNIESMEIRFDNEWQEASFASAIGTIGTIGATVSSNLVNKTTTDAYNVFIGGSYYRSSSAFSSSDPYDQSKDNYIEIAFDEAVAIQGYKIKGGYGTGGVANCGPDDLELQASEDGTNYTVLAEGAVTADTTASVYTHVFDGDKPTSIALSYDVNQIDISWVSENPNTSGFLLVKSSTDSAFTPVSGTVYTTGSYGSYDILVVSNTFSYNDASWDNSQSFYYTVYGYDSSNIYSDPLQVQAEVQDFSNYHQYYRILINSLTDCSKQKSYIETLELELNGEWQDSAFSSKNGTIGAYSVQVTGASQSSNAWKAFADGYAWNTGKKFSSSDPFDSTSDQWIKFDFSAASQGSYLTGLRIKGGYGTGNFVDCSPDDWEVQYSDDNSSWTTLPNGGFTDSTSTEMEVSVE